MPTGSRSRPRSRSISRGASLAAAAAAWLAAVPSAFAGWSRPLSIAAPLGSDLIPAQLGLAPDGVASVVGFGATLAGNPASSTARVVLGGATGRFAPARQLPGAAAVLAAAYPAGHPEVLAGTTVPGLACCSAVAATALDPRGRIAGTETIVSNLGGATVGVLQPLAGGLLAAVATADGVWVSAARLGHGATTFPVARRLYGASGVAPLLAATALPKGRSLVAWTSTVPGSSWPGVAEEIHIAGGAGNGAPRRSRVLVTVPAGYSLDSLSVAPHGSGSTIAWTESWYDASGASHSQVETIDLGVRNTPVPVSNPAALAQDVSLAADRRGDELATWQSCDGTGACVTGLALRPLGRGWGPAGALGALDSGGAPVASYAARGPGLVTWAQAGHVVAAATRGPGRIGPTVTVSRTSLASDIAIAQAPGGRALAAWTQGTYQPAVDGARYRP